MKQWEVFDYHFRHPIGVHPAVILTPTEPLANPDLREINLLIVTTVRAGYQPGKYDVMLNGADGLDHLSRVRVYPIYQVFKEDLGRYRGVLSSTRQQAVTKKIRDVYRLG
jgi:hypothetical protein